MLKKALRLRTKEDFERVFRKGNPLFFGSIVCKIIPNALPHLRLGFSFSKKHLPLASSRNRLRRILSEPFSRNRKILRGDVVIFTVKKLEKSDFGTVASISENIVKYINK